MMYSGDDDSYMAHTTSLVFFQFPSYSKENFTYGKGVPLHSIGASLLASPFVFAASIIDRISKNEVIDRRSASNILKSWTAFGFTLASIFYLWLTCLLLYEGLTFYFQPQISSIAVILSVLFQGVALFAFRRPVFSHIYEMFLQSLFLFLLFRLNKFGGYILGGERLKDLWEAVFIGFLISLVSLVRPNNVFISLVWPVILFSFYYPKITKARIIRMIVVSYLFMTALISLFQVWPIFVNLPDIHQYKGYFSHEIIKNYLLTLYNPGFYLKRLGYILWGFDWGLIFTAPYIILGLVSLFWIRNKEDKLYKYLIWAILPIVINLYLTLVQRDQGSWYGYRYLIFSLIPVIIYPLAKLISLFKDKKQFFYYMIILIAIVPMLSMLSFESNDSNLTLKVINQEFGVSGWGNSVYQLEIYKTILLNPIQYLTGILKGGPAYLIYLMSTFLGCKQYLPIPIYDKYGMFQLTTLIKTMIVYLFPFILLLIYQKYVKKYS